MSRQKKSDKKYPVEKLLLITATIELIKAFIELTKELIREKGRGSLPYYKNNLLFACCQ